MLRQFRRLSAIALTTVCLSGVMLTPNAEAGFYKVIPPPSGQGGEKEVDPPVTPPGGGTPPSAQSPEPGTLTLAILGGGALAAWRRKRNKAE